MSGIRLGSVELKLLPLVFAFLCVLKAREGGTFYLVAKYRYPHLFS